MQWVIGLGIWIVISAVTAPWIGSFIDGRRSKGIDLTPTQGSALAPRKRP
jgi:hypothetical protein